jgi:hypothetical protein
LLLVLISGQQCAAAALLLVAALWLRLRPLHAAAAPTTPRLA